MHGKAWVIYDRSGWPRGEWDSEVDKIQWMDEKTNYPCVVFRNPMGSLCGYVGLDHKHPDYRKQYDDIDVNVHGGLTFSDFQTNRELAELEQNDNQDIWWLGFDCAHFMDVTPTLVGFFSGGIYRNIDYVVGEVKNLASQLKEKEKRKGMK